MLSYKQYKALNESVMPSFTLGVANPSNLGISSPFASFEEAKKMAKKKAKKKMFGDEEETGDGEMVPPASEKDEPDVDVDTGEDEGGSCGDMCNAKSKKKSKKKMWSDEDDAPEMDDEEMDDEEMDDEEAPEEGEEDVAPEEDEEEEVVDKGAGVGAPMFSKKKSSKKSKKKCSSGDDMEMDDEDEEMDDEMDGKELAFSKKKSKKNLKKEATDEEKWWNSVHNMMGPAPDTKYSDGWTEYQSSEFTPVDTENLTQAVRQEPEAGQVGFAPQKAMGSFFG